MGQAVVHFEVIGKDVEKLRSYYSDMFGWDIDANNPMNYGIVTTGEGIGGGVGSGGDGSGHATFYVQVDDVKAYLDRAEKLGGRAIMGPMDVPGGPTIALFADPEGHVVGLVKGM